MTKKPSLETRIRVALEELGGSVEEIAATLLRKGFKGYQWNGQSCPIARYLKEEVLVDEDEEVVKDLVVTNDEVRIDGIEVELSEPCWMFVDAFDYGKIPDLIAEE